MYYTVVLWYKLGYVVSYVGQKKGLMLFLNASVNIMD